MNTSLDKLRNLVGMEKIAAQFEQCLLSMRMSREKDIPCRGHMALMSNPGAGKTTAARLFCKILHEKGLLSKGQFVSVTPFDLIGQYIGETETKTRAVCKSAIGGVLYIDEAYGLMARYGAGYDYAHEAINVIVNFMTSTEANDTIVMFAGYPDKIRRLLDINSGLKSRISFIFVFDDFVPEDLYKIFIGKLDGHEVSDELKTKMQRVIKEQYKRRNTKSWGNARTMEMYAKKILQNHLVNHNGEGVIDVDCIPEHLFVNKEIMANSIYEKNEKQLKKEMLLIVDELQTKLQELQSKLDELSEK